MAFTIADRVLDTTTSTASPFALSGTAPAGYKTFLAGVGNTNTCYYTIQNPGNGEWETGTATLTAGTTLTRVTLIGSSTGVAVTFSAGTKYIFVALPASKNVYLDNSNVVNVAGDVTANSYNGGQLAGFRNKIINGDMRVAQRATSYAITTAVTYGCQDRWAVQSISAGAATLYQTTGTDTDGFASFAKIQRNLGVAATGAIRIATALETVDSISMQGKTVTYSFYAKAGADFSGSGVSSVNYALKYGTGTDESVGRLLGSGTAWTGVGGSSGVTAITTTLTRYSFTVSIPSNATQIGLIFGFDPTGTAGLNDYVEITGVQLEVGSVATPYEHIAYATQLALCQRYYEKNAESIGYCFSTTSMIFMCMFKVTKRVNPTVVALLSTTPSIEYPWYMANISATNASISATHLGINGTSISIINTTAIWNPTTGVSAMLYAGSVYFSAEL